MQLNILFKPEWNPLKSHLHETRSHLSNVEEHAVGRGGRRESKRGKFSLEIKFIEKEKSVCWRFRNETCEQDVD